MVPEDRLLEWRVGDGWEPLCKFLGKEIPDEPFPHVNAAGKGFKDRENDLLAHWSREALRNFILVSSGIAMVVAAGIKHKVLWSAASGFLERG